MRTYVACLTLTMLLAGTACRRSQTERVDVASCASEDTTGAVQAVVRDASSAAPMAGVEVVTNDWQGAATDALGRGCITDLGAGEVRLRAEQPGFVTESLTARVLAAQTTNVAFALRRAPLPCCRLDGSWWIRFDLKRPAAVHPKPVARSVSGLVVFSQRLPNPFERMYNLSDSIVRYEFGYSAVDFTPFFGGAVAQDVSRTVWGPAGVNLLREVVGIIPTRDSVSLTFIPRMSHGSLGLTGRVARDTIRGLWVQSASCCGAGGRFTMYRLAPSTEADSIIALAVRDYESTRRAVQLAEAEQRRREGHVRLRVYDEATRRHIGANFWLVRDEPQPGGFLATMIRSGYSGWGEYEGIEPGDYDLWLSDFPCGKQTYFADEAFGRQDMSMARVPIRSGERVDRDIRINTRAIKTKSSYENRAAQKCAQ